MDSEIFSINTITIQNSTSNEKAGGIMIEKIFKIATISDLFITDVKAVNGYAGAIYINLVKEISII